MLIIVSLKYLFLYLVIFFYFISKCIYYESNYISASAWCESETGWRESGNCLVRRNVTSLVRGAIQNRILTSAVSHTEAIMYYTRTKIIRQNTLLTFVFTFETWASNRGGFCQRADNSLTKYKVWSVVPIYSVSQMLYLYRPTRLFLSLIHI